MATITALISYPIKSCKGIELSETRLTAAGLAHDRAFMVVGPDGVFRSQRRDPRLALIQPDIDAAGRQLTLHAPDADPIRITVDATGIPRPVTLFGTGYRGIDQGDRVARWLTEVLDAPSRLVRVPPDHHRITDGLTPGTSGYADSCPVHLISTESLAHLNDLIAARGGNPVPMSRFRLNIVVEGWPEPYREDLALRIAVADAELGYAKPAIRCVITMVDQLIGTRTGPEPLRTLATYRRADGGVAFGAKFAVPRPGRIAVGDECTVTAVGPASVRRPMARTSSAEGACRGCRPVPGLAGPGLPGR
ncbi:MOSC domain-containing protein [Nocardia terpenica]|uniref:MOSC domain-containing protein n=1 Tax=Nocardia terpenica TaxID=455432 RepID=A0A291RQ06_9NOCA|nr:MOSC N-terminal beta barrel domain-containing protein [Nocardia terpenica]ATL69395.1 MOSC domain-containing protein [Nocardia terpenica]